MNAISNNSENNSESNLIINPYLTMWYHGVLDLTFKFVPVSVIMAPLLSEQLPSVQRWSTTQLFNFIKIKSYNLLDKHPLSDEGYPVYDYPRIKIKHVASFLRKAFKDERLDDEFLHPVELHFRSFLYAVNKHNLREINKTDLFKGEEGYTIYQTINQTIIRYETVVSSLLKYCYMTYPNIDLTIFLPLALKRERTFNKDSDEPQESTESTNSLIHDVFMPALFKNSLHNLDLDRRFRGWEKLSDDDIRNKLKFVQLPDKNDEEATLNDFLDPHLVRSFVDCEIKHIKGWNRTYYVCLSLERAPDFFKHIHFTVYNPIVQELFKECLEGQFDNVSTRRSCITKNKPIKCDIQNLSRFVAMNDQADWNITQPNLQKFGNILNMNPHLFNNWFVVEHHPDQSLDDKYGEYAIMSTQDLVHPEYLAYGFRWGDEKVKSPYKGCIMDEKDIKPYLMGEEQEEQEDQETDTRWKRIRSTHPYWPIHDPMHDKTFWLIAHKRKGRYYVDGSTLPVPIRTYGYIDLVSALYLIDMFIERNRFHPSAEWRGKYNNLYCNYWNAVSTMYCTWLRNESNPTADSTANSIIDDYTTRRRHTLKGDWESDDRYPPATNKLVHYPEIAIRTMNQKNDQDKHILEPSEELFSDDEENPNWSLNNVNTYDEELLFEEDEDTDSGCD